MLPRPLAATARRRMFQSFLGGERIARIARARRAEKSLSRPGIGNGSAHPTGRQNAPPPTYVHPSIGYLFKRPEYLGRKC